MDFKLRRKKSNQEKNPSSNALVLHDSVIVKRRGNVESTIEQKQEAGGMVYTEMKSLIHVCNTPMDSYPRGSLFICNECRSKWYLDTDFNSYSYMKYWHEMQWYDIPRRFKLWRLSHAK